MTTRGTSGPTPFASWSSQEQIWVSSRMSLDLQAQGTSEKYSARWPKTGSMRSGVCSEQTTLALPTSASGSGFWPTATAVARECDEQQWEQRRIQQRGSLRSTYLQDAVKYQVQERTYPTPNTNDFKDPNSNPKANSGHGLAAAVKFPTPTATDAKSGGNRTPSAKTHAGTSLTDLVQRFPTPKCSDANGAGCHGTGAPNLTTVVSGGTETRRTYGTPLSTDGKGGSSTHVGTKARGLLRHQVQPDSCRRLNPDWEAWLMGWPVGWEDSLTPLPTRFLTAWHSLFLYELSAFASWVTAKCP
jgi:hypothetical protein